MNMYATSKSSILFLLMNIMILLLDNDWVAELCLYTRRYLQDRNITK